MPWLLWLLSSLLGSAVFAYVLIDGEDRTAFMPGPLTDGHHQLAESCDSCHTDAFGGGEVLQESCIACHGDLRQEPFDSHPKSKFDDPRNADRLASIDARTCISCHVEHQPEHTLAHGVTQPADVCSYCHSDIGTERESHAGMDFMTCGDAGCHNYHDNRALYTEFLIKHAEAPDFLAGALVPMRDYADVFQDLLNYPREAHPIEALRLSDADVNPDSSVDSVLLDEWAASSHAAKGVNCSGCHQPRNPEGEQSAWVDDPGTDGCAGCHDIEVAQFGNGKHGMRLAEGLSAMTPAQSRLPMHDNAGHESMDCASCHQDHSFETRTAAVDACLGCHADEHSLAYEGSPHHALWLSELDGSGEPGSGVSCATCHMPRETMDVDDWNARVVVNHNQSANLTPSSKMIRSSCMACHGLPFAIDALADPALARNNYSGLPSTQVPSVDMAVEFREAALRRKAEQQSRNQEKETSQ